VWSSTRSPSRAATRSSRTPRLSSKPELLAVPPIAAAAIGVFYDGGYGADARIGFAVAAATALVVVAAREPGAVIRAAREPMALALVALAVLGALSALWTLGPDERTLRWAAVTLGYAAVFAAAAGAAHDERGRIALAVGIGAVATVSGALALIATALHEEPYALEIGGGWRPAGPLEYPPALALLMVCALPVFAEAIRARGSLIRVAGAAGVALSTAVVALTQSRLALALGLIVAAAFVYRTTRRATAVAAGAAVLLVAGLLAFGPGDGPESGFLHGREDTWGAAVETFVDRPVEGTGADAFLAGSARHQDGAAIAFAHSLPLELAAELGLLGLLLALALYATTAELVWTTRATNAVWLFAPAALAFLAANLLDWPWHLASLGAIWSLACGALAGTRASPANLPGSAFQLQGDP
jgi:O-antigen ligase